MNVDLGSARPSRSGARCSSAAPCSTSPSSPTSSGASGEPRGLRADARGDGRGRERACLGRRLVRARLRRRRPADRRRERGTAPDQHEPADRGRDRRASPRRSGPRRRSRSMRRSPRDRARDRAPLAAVRRRRPARARHLDLPAGREGERRHLLPRQRLGDRRRRDGRLERPRVRLLPAHPPAPAHRLRPLPRRALRVLPEHLRSGPPAVRHGPERLADRHCRLDVRRRRPSGSSGSGRRIAGCASPRRCRAAGRASRRGASSAVPSTRSEPSARARATRSRSWSAASPWRGM